MKKLYSIIVVIPSIHTLGGYINQESTFRGLPTLCNSKKSETLLIDPNKDGVIKDFRRRTQNSLNSIIQGAT